MEKEERAQTARVQMSMWANAMKMLLAGTDGQEPWRGAACSEKCPDEKKHSTKVTTADQPRQLPPLRRATSPNGETLCEKEQRTDRAFDSLSAPPQQCTSHSIQKSKMVKALQSQKNYGGNTDTELTSDFSAECPQLLNRNYF